MKPGDTHLVEGKVMMVVKQENGDKYILVRLVGSTTFGQYRFKQGMIEYLKPFTKLSRGM